MASSRGYRNYRGRRSKGKIALVVVLILVILAAVAVMALQRNIVYDEAGVPHLEVPWQKEPEEAALPDVDLVVQEPEGADLPALQGFSVEEGPLTAERWETVRSRKEAFGEAPAVAITLKDRQGHVFFDAASAVPDARELRVDTMAALETALEETEYAVARIACFRDPLAANSDVEKLGLENTGGYIFYDGRNSQWLDPAKPEARAYLCGIIKEAAALGFDEILLTDACYPTEGKLEKIDYGEAEKTASLAAFLEEARAALEPFGTALSVEVPASLVTEGALEAAGLTLSEVASRVDRIYAPAAPEEIRSLETAVGATGTAAFVAEVTEAVPDFSGSWIIR